VSALTLHPGRARRRDALRTQFPTLHVSRAAAHAFATAPRGWALPRDAPSWLAPHATPFGTLRIAQLAGLGVPLPLARLAAPHLLPPLPCADAEEEAARLAVARLLVPAMQHAAEPPAADKPPRRWEQLRAAAAWAAHVPAWRDADLAQRWLTDVHHLLVAQRDAALPLSGCTVGSLGRRASEARREAAVSEAVADAGLGAAPRSNGTRLPQGTWRAPLRWDARCDAMFDAHAAAAFPVAPHAGAAPSADVELMPAQLRWPLLLPANERSNSDGVDGDDSDDRGVLHGVWRAQMLVTQEAILEEGHAQRNCLRHGWYNVRGPGRFWSLQLLPAPGELERLAGGGEQLRQARRALRRLRLTVELADGSPAPRVYRAHACCNQLPLPAARSALRAWLQRKAAMQCDT
jgi:hypothetical protein